MSKGYANTPDRKAFIQHEIRANGEEENWGRNDLRKKTTASYKELQGAWFYQVYKQFMRLFAVIEWYWQRFENHIHQRGNEIETIQDAHISRLQPMLPMDVTHGVSWTLPRLPRLPNRVSYRGYAKSNFLCRFLTRCLVLWTSNDIARGVNTSTQSAHNSY